jgi:hypothetical protein
VEGKTYVSSLGMEDGVTPRFRFRRLSDGTFGWMLQGGNNRLIGTSATGSPTPARAVTAAERAREIVATVDATFTVADDRLWYWRIVEDGAPVAVSASGFARRLDAQRAAKRFVRAAGTAYVQLGVVTVPDRVRERPGPSRTGTR